MPRMEWLLRAVTAIEMVNTSSKVLVIGPRTENDILTLKGFGISNVRGLDLISYSPFVDLGDMHKMPYGDDSFDVIVCGWTISYSSSPANAMKEILRVIKDDGIVAFGLEHAVPYSIPDKVYDARLIRPFENKERINSCEDLERLIGVNLGEVFFRHNAPLKHLERDKIEKITSLSSSQVMYVASIQK